jgi:subfamily B ATP-binding cassette protein MsbA
MKAWLSILREIAFNLHRLRPILRPGRWLVVAVIATATLSALFEGVGIGAMVPLISMLKADAGHLLEVLKNDKVLRWLPAKLPGHSASLYIAVFCAIIVFLIVCKNLALLMSQNLMARMVRIISANLRLAIFQRLQQTSIQVFEERKFGELGNVFSIETIRTQSTIEFTLLLIQKGMIAAFYVIAIVVISWELTLGLVVLVLVVSGLSALGQMRLKRRGDERSKAQHDLFGYLGGVFSGMRVVRTNHAEAETEREFERRNEHLAEVERRAAVMNALMAPISEILAVVGAMFLVWGAYAILIPHNRLSGPLLGAVGFILIRTLPLLNQLYAIMGQLSYSSGGMREIFVWLDLPVYPKRPFGHRTFEGIRSGIRLDGVGYRYPNGTVALENIHLEIPSGKTVALVGGSGSGKSTLASLLLRLREPTSGAIRVDGVDFWEFSPASWHSRLGMVEQEAFLFNETVEHNITFGSPNTTPKQLQRALKVAHLEEVVSGLPLGLQTVVGERGTMLSGGQKQRLAIARAMIREPLFLILDEATSALDNVSERQVQAALDEARRGRTSVVIAHRLSTIRNADLIVVLSEGRIVETGTWDELEARNGAFQALLAAARGGHLSSEP